MRKTPPIDSEEIVSRADELRGLCAAVTKIARRDLQARLDRHAAGINAIEHGVIRHLSEGVSSMAEISRLMGTSPSTLVYVVDRLVEKELVRRGKDTKDRRREPLLLEKKGAELFTRVPKMEKHSVLVQSLRQMTERRQRQLVELMSQFVCGLPGSQDFQTRLDAKPSPSGISLKPKRRVRRHTNTKEDATNE